MENVRVYKTDSGIYVTDKSNTVLIPEGDPKFDKERPYKLGRYDSKDNLVLITDCLFNLGDIVAPTQLYKSGDAQIVSMDVLRRMDAHENVRTGLPVNSSSTILLVLPSVPRELYASAEEQYQAAQREYRSHVGTIDEEIRQKREALERERKERIAQLQKPDDLGQLLFKLCQSQ